MDNNVYRLGSSYCESVMKCFIDSSKLSGSFSRLYCKSDAIP